MEREADARSFLGPTTPQVELRQEQGSSPRGESVVTPELEKFETDVKTTSMASEETAHGMSPQLVYTIISQLTSLLAMTLTDSYIVTVTDMYLLAFTAAVMALIVITMLTQMILYLFKPIDLDRVYDVRSLGSYLNTIILFLKLLFFTALYTAFSLLLILFKSLFLINAENVVVALLALFVDIFLILGFVAHPSVNLITHLAPLVEPAV